MKRSLSVVPVALIMTTLAACQTAGDDAEQNGINGSSQQLGAASSSGPLPACTQEQIEQVAIDKPEAAVPAIAEYQAFIKCQPTCEQLAAINNKAQPNWQKYATDRDPKEPKAENCINRQAGAVWSAFGVEVCCLTAPGPLNDGKDHRSIGGAKPAVTATVTPASSSTPSVVATTTPASTTVPAPSSTTPVSPPPPPAYVAPAPLPAPISPTFPLRTCQTSEDFYGYDAFRAGNLFNTVQWLKRNVCEPKCAQLVIWNANRPYIPESPPGTVPGMGLCSSAYNGSDANRWINTCNNQNGTLWVSPDCAYCCVTAAGPLNDHRGIHRIGPEQ